MDTGVKEREGVDKKLPDGWKWVKLGDVCQTTSGGTPSRSVPSYYEGNIPWVKSGDLNDGLIFETDESITQEAIDNSSAKIFPIGTLLIAMYGATVGKLGILAIEAATNQAVCGIFCRELLIDRNYLFCYLLQQRRQLIESSFGGAQPNISQDIIRAIKIPLPPLAEQKRIAAILNEQMEAVDKARKATEAQLDAAKQLPAAYLRAVFNNPEAQKWERKKLGELCQIDAPQVDPKLPQYGSLPHVNGENIESGTCRLTYLNTAFQDGMTSGKYLFNTGDVLYSKLRPYLRKVVFVDFQGLCSADMYPIKVNPIFLNPQFTAWLLISDHFTEYAVKESRRARMPKLNREELFAYNAPIPSISEQKQIAAELSSKMADIETLQKSLESQLEAINQLPAAIMRQAFNGKL